MGFFFTNQTKVAKRNGTRGLRQAPPTKQNTAILSRLGCAACPLNDADVVTPKMKPTLAEKTSVYFLSKGPSKYEDEARRPLCGKGGMLLRECIPDDWQDECSYDNVIRDRTPGSRLPAWQEIECCRGHIVKSIEQAKPLVVIGLGVTPLAWMLNSRDLIGLRGRLFAVKIGSHQCWFLPTHDPDEVIEKAFKKDDPLRSKLGHCLKLDVERAINLSGRLPAPKIDSEIDARAAIQCFDGTRGYPDLLELLKRASKAPIKAVDIETSCLRPYAATARILTCAISFDAVNFSFAVDHPKARWQPNQTKELLKILGGILADDTIKIAHNAPFEIEWFVSYLGTEVINHDIWECTQLQAHFIDERREGQSLDDLCRQHFGVAYKSFFKLDKKNMADADLGETLIYNAADTKYTLKLWHRQCALLERLKLTRAYRDALPRQVTVAAMQCLGIGIDQDEVKRVQKALTVEIDEIKEDINNLKVIKAYKKDNGGNFNPNSGPELLKIFKDYLKRPEIKVDTKSLLDFDQPSASKYAIRMGQVEGEKYSLAKGILGKIDHPLAHLIIELRNRAKLKSTNADGFELGIGADVWPDNMAHTSFNTTFTETGRLSSSGPNQQNWPHRNDAWIRKIVVAPKGHVILAFDYGQLEGCTAAMCSLDKVLVKALWEDYDIHMEWTKKLVARYPLWLGSGEDISDKATAKKYRGIVKNKLVFPAIFGASNASISGYLHAPDDVVEDIMNEFWKTFSGLQRWQKNVMTDYYNTGYVTSPNGRRHNYPLTKNQAVNFPVQSVAADIVCESMNTLSRHAVKTGEWHIHPVLNIHDDLSFIVPRNRIDDAVEIITEVMLTPPYKFINVPLSVEASYGQNWYEMKTIGKFWSNKDVGNLN